MSEFQEHLSSTVFLTFLVGFALPMYVGTFVWLYRDTKRHGASPLVATSIVLGSFLLLSALWLPLTLAWLIFSPDPAPSRSDLPS